MARFTSDDDTRRLGEALADLRRERGLSQAEAGQRVGMTSQGWGLYEAGRRPGLYRPDVQRRLTAALEATPEDLLLRAAPPATPPVAAPASGVEATGRAFRPGPSAEVRMMQLTGDEMAPWASAGVTVAYRPGQAPRRGQGCVVRLTDGRRIVALFDEGGEVLHLSRPNGDRLDLARSEVAELSAIVGRLEDS